MRNRKPENHAQLLRAYFHLPAIRTMDERAAFLMKT